MHYGIDMESGDLYAFSGAEARDDWKTDNKLGFVITLESLPDHDLKPTDALCEHGELAGQCEVGSCWNSNGSALGLLKADAGALVDYLEEVKICQEVVAEIIEEERAIEELRAAAEQAGDEAQVELCEKAMDGDQAAVEKCLRVLGDAKVQEDSQERAEVEVTTTTYCGHHRLEVTGGSPWPLPAWALKAAKAKETMSGRKLLLKEEPGSFNWAATVEEAAGDWLPVKVGMESVYRATFRNTEGD